MKLTVRDAGQLLGVTEKTVYQWIREGVIPVHLINEQYRFNRAELLEWATARGIDVSPEIFAGPGGGESAPPSLGDALEEGGIHYHVGGTDTASVLHAVVDQVKLPEGMDRTFLIQVLLAREALGSTGIGEGIAIPHVRNPIVLHLPRPTVTLCFLEHAVDFGALDGRPVTTLFTLITPTVRTHLHLLSRLGFALRNPDFKNVVLRQAPPDEIVAALRRVELSMGGDSPAVQPISR